MMTSWVPSFGGHATDTEPTDDSNLHDLSMEEGTDESVVSYGQSVRHTHSHGRKNIETADFPVSVGDVGASGHFRYIKSRKFTRRAYLCLAIVATFFVFSILVRLAIKGAPNDSTKEIDYSRMSTREAHAVMMMMDLAGTQEDLMALRDAGSPQRQALQWIANDDQLALEIPETSFETDYPAFLQRYSAAVLAFAWGPEQLAPLGFLSSEDECTWHADYKRPDSSTLRMGLICNGDQHQVVKIVLQTLGLTGTIPREIEHFHAVKHLHLDGNELTGTLQHSMMQLHQLTELTLTRNQLQGHLPKWLGKSTSLSHVELSKNQFSGSLASGFAKDVSANATLQQGDIVADAFCPIKVLAVDNNALSGAVNTLGHLPHLEELYLNDNHLTGHLSSEHFHGLDRLAIVDASKNKLEGKIPDKLLELPSLAVLDLSKNGFTGQFPHGNSMSLKFINVGSNFISGVVPRSIGKHPALAYLDLSNNRITGGLPTNIGTLKELQFLFLQHNSFLKPGPLPEFLLNLNMLESASLKDTSLNGTIPDWVGKLTNLEYLDLELNDLSGSIPASMGNMTSMKYLFLNRNQFSGSIPDSLGGLSDLVLLNLDHNSFTGHVGDPICAHAMEVLVADCAATPEQDLPMLECACCTHCCEPTGTNAQNCNTRDWGLKFGEDWSNYFERYNIIDDGDVFQLIESSQKGGGR